MLYRDIVQARFCRRLNRFVAQADLGNGPEPVHVKNTGRCAELLVPGCRAWLQDAGPGTTRKTRYDLIAVEKIRPGREPLLVNLDSAAPNAVAGEWLAGGGLGPLEELRPEYRLGGSRFDFFARRPGGQSVLVEVKGCTLEQDGLARFPDAPTLRGEKHVRELTELRAQGYECAVLFILQMEQMRRFTPNWDTHPSFGAALAKAQAAGVQVLALGCRVQPDQLEVAYTVPVDLTVPGSV